MDKKSRSTIEMNDKTIRPAIADQNARIDEYNTIFLGFPIWWYVAPTIINTFLESYDFSGKKIILFATSGGSKFGKTVEELKVSVPDSCEIIEGKLLNGIQTIPSIRKWTESLNLYHKKTAGLDPKSHPAVIPLLHFLIFPDKLLCAFTHT